MKEGTGRSPAGGKKESRAAKKKKTVLGRGKCAVRPQQRKKTPQPEGERAPNEEPLRKKKKKTVQA